MIEVAQAADLAAILEARDDPMTAVRELSWLKPLRKVPANASPPLAMSGPHPKAVGSYGPGCVKWAKAELGVTLRWWQALAISRQLEHDEDGVLVWREIVESGSRRIGKSVRLRTVALWRLQNAERFNETQLAMLVSKDLAVGKEIHRGAWRWAEQKGWSVTRLNGAQEVETRDGDRWLLRAPNAAYGYDVGYGQVDESWDVDPMAITDGIEPALLERESPQLHLTSTGHAKATSLMRRRLVAALRDADPDVLLLFWGARPGADIADEKTWRASSAHWTKQRRDLIARKYAAALAGDAEPEFDDPDPLRGFAAQYLNVWPGLLQGRGDGIFPKWSSLAVAKKREPAPAALGIAADLEGAWLSLGASSHGKRPHLGAVLRLRADNRSAFVSEVARIQLKRGCPVALDPKGPAGFVKKDLENAGVQLLLLGVDDVVGASSNIRDKVKASGISHGDYPELNAAVDAAGWRMVGDRKVIGRRGGDVSMLEAVAFALWAAELNDYDVEDSFL